MTETTFDELAGVVDLFGALTGEELVDALGELAFKRGQSVDREALAAAVDDAVAAYYLVHADPANGAGDSDSGDGSDGDDGSGTVVEPGALLAVGPVAFPVLPPGGEDLPHILDVARREVDRAALGGRVVDQFRAESRAALADGDADAVATLVDVSYDLEAWAPVDVSETRASLAAALADGDA